MKSIPIEKVVMFLTSDVKKDGRKLRMSKQLGSPKYYLNKELRDAF